MHHMSVLLAVDLGLRTGLALFGDDGRVLSYQSRNFGTSTRLRSAVHAMIAGTPDLAWLVMEGGGNLAEIWRREAERAGVKILQIAAEQWRETLFYEREHRNGPQAKQHAIEMARHVIDWSGAARPTSLRHDAAEAILIGLYGVLHVGWLKRLPAGLHD
jgi:hypothetical protein